MVSSDGNYGAYLCKNANTGVNPQSQNFLSYLGGPSGSTVTPVTALIQCNGSTDTISFMLQAAGTPNYGTFTGEFNCEMICTLLSSGLQGPTGVTGHTGPRSAEG